MKLEPDNLLPPAFLKAAEETRDMQDKPFEILDPMKLIAVSHQ